MSLRNYRFTINSEDELDLESKQIAVKNKELLHQINNVLRLNQDSKEDLSFIDGSGKVYEVTIEDLSQKFINFKIDKIYESKRELNKEINFLVPVIKLEAFSFMVRKLTELGVQKIIPIKFSRSQKQNISSLEKDSQRKRLKKIIQEATEQCEGAVFAELADQIDLDSALASIPKNSLKIFASERMANQAEHQNFAVQSEYQEAKQVCLLVGPEGGLTDEEAEILLRNEFRQYSLGRRLLKAETAAIALVSNLGLA